MRFLESSLQILSAPLFRLDPFRPSKFASLVLSSEYLYSRMFSLVVITHPHAVSDNSVAFSHPKDVASSDMSIRCEKAGCFSDPAQPAKARCVEINRYPDGPLGAVRTGAIMQLRFALR